MAAGAIVAMAFSLIAYAGAPLFRNWTEREARISASADQLVTVATLIASQDTLFKTVSALERTSGTQRQLLTARTPSLAASELQRVMRMYAERSRISIDRLEFSSPDESSTAGAAVIRFTMSAVGDIYGITDFLAMLRSESPVVEVSEMSLISNSALKAGLIQFSATVRAPVVIQ